MSFVLVRLRGRHVLIGQPTYDRHEQRCRVGRDARVGAVRLVTVLDRLRLPPRSADDRTDLLEAPAGHVDGGRMRVRDLEALDGTPVIDVKPLLRTIDER